MKCQILLTFHKCLLCFMYIIFLGLLTNKMGKSLIFSENCTSVCQFNNYPFPASEVLACPTLVKLPCLPWPATVFFLRNTTFCSMHLIWWSCFCSGQARISGLNTRIQSSGHALLTYSKRTVYFRSEIGCIFRRLLFSLHLIHAWLEK